MDLVERILLVRLELAGGDDDEFDFRLEHAKSIVGKIRTSLFTRYDAEIIYSER